MIETPIAISVAQQTRGLCNGFSSLSDLAQNVLLRWDAQQVGLDVPNTSEAIADAQQAARPISGADVRAVMELAGRILGQLTPEDKALVNRLRTNWIG